MQEFDVTSFSIVIASLSVVLGVILAILQLRDQKKNRQAQLFMEIYARVTSAEFLEMRFLIGEAFSNLEQNENPELWESRKEDMLSVLFLFEGIGVLVKRGLIDVALVADMTSVYIIRIWESIEAWVSWRRETDNLPQFLKWFEYLYHRIRNFPSTQSTAKNTV